MAESKVQGRLVEICRHTRAAVRKPLNRLLQLQVVSFACRALGGAISILGEIHRVDPVGYMSNINCAVPKQ